MFREVERKSEPCIRKSETYLGKFREVDGNIYIYIYIFKIQTMQLVLYGK